VDRKQLAATHKSAGAGLAAGVDFHRYTARDGNNRQVAGRGMFAPMPIAGAIKQAEHTPGNERQVLSLLQSDESATFVPVLGGFDELHTWNDLHVNPQRLLQRGEESRGDSPFRSGDPSVRSG
jgi:hypothetical protein